MTDRRVNRSDAAAEFEQQAQERGHGIAGEFLAYLRETKKWWITPVLIVLLLLGGLIMLGGSGAAPFIYTLF